MTEEIKSFTEEDVEALVQVAGARLLAMTGLTEIPASRALFLRHEIRDVLDALAAAGRLLPPDAEHREEWEVRWLSDRGGICMHERHLISRASAEELGPARVGEYGITSYSVHRRTHRIFGDGSSFTGPWVEVENTSEETSE